MLLSILQRQRIVPRYDEPFQPLTPDHEAWLNRWEHEGAKELTLQALRVCIDLVSPAATGVASRLTEADRVDILLRWHTMHYSSTTFKEVVNVNIATAMEIHRLSSIVGDDTAFVETADSFLDAAGKQYANLTANGM